MGRKPWFSDINRKDRFCNLALQSSDLWSELAPNPKSLLFFHSKLPALTRIKILMVQFCHFTFNTIYRRGNMMVMMLITMMSNVNDDDAIDVNVNDDDDDLNVHDVRID